MQMLRLEPGQVEASSSITRDEPGSSSKANTSKSGDSPIAKGFEDLDDDIPF